MQQTDRARVIQMIALLTVLSLATSILVIMTSFIRIAVVLSLLRTALGTATAPPSAVALFLTAFVMDPALQKAYDTLVKPLGEGRTRQARRYLAARAGAGFHDLRAQARLRDRRGLREPSGYGSRPSR